MRKYWLFVGIVFAIAVSGLATASVSAASEPTIPTAPSLSRPIVDQTGTLDDAHISLLASTISSTRSKKDYQIGVLMIPTLNGYPIEQYSIDVARKWGIGDKDKNNGILLIIAKDDHLLRIEVGSGLEGDLTDIQSSHIINDVITPEFKKGDFFTGIQKGIESIAALVQGQADPHPAGTGSQQDFSGIMTSIFVFGGAGLVWLGSIFGRSKSWWAGGVVGGVAGLAAVPFTGWGWWSFGIVGLLIGGGLLFDRAVSRNYRENLSQRSSPAWWAGGMWGGGGSSGGGGGGGFGGGGFSGGGSSGSW